MNTRTYGTYAYLATGISDGTRHPDNAKPKWSMTLEPAVAIRAKRLFARARSYVSGRVVVNATPETARDLAWLLERFPLLPEDEKSERLLREHAHEHERIEQQVGEVLAGTHLQLPLSFEPARPARDYQRAAVDLLRTTRSLLLTDEVGLGKTFTGLLALAHDDALPAVIVPPTHLPSRWVSELQESFPTLSFRIAKTTKVSPEFEAGDRPDVMIVPYSRLTGWAHHLQGWARTVIFDEVQDLRRGTESQKGSAAKMIADGATYRLGLTATPVYNYGGEVWQLLNILAPGILGTYDEFAREWGGSWGRHSTVKQPAVLGSYLREQGVMLGRTRQEVGRELPRPSRSPSSSTPTRKRSSRSLATRPPSRASSSTSSRHSAGKVPAPPVSSTGSSGKRPALRRRPTSPEFVRLLLEAEGKVVLFGLAPRRLRRLERHARSAYNPVMYTGTESPKQKDEAPATPS